jgi:hypothetical protein
MATIISAKAGNWSDTTVWVGGVLPGVNDLAQANHNITIDQNINVQGLRLGAVVVFTASGNTTRNITLNNSASFANYGYNATVLNITNTGTTNISTYMPVLGTNQSNIGLSSNGGTININVLDNLSSSSVANGFPISVGGLNQIINITGNSTGLSGFRILNIAGTNNTVNYTGNIYGTSTTGGYHITFSGTNPVLNFVGILYTSGSNIIQTGNATGNINIDGIIQGGLVAGVSSSSSQTVTVSGQIINLNDINAVYAKYLRVKNTLDTQMTFQTEVLNTNKTIYSAPTSIGLPAITNVRTGVVYGDASQFTGTMTVPSPSDVRVNVPTDNTVGTASLTAEDLWNRLTSAITTSNSIGKLLKDNIDDTISSKATDAGVVTELNTSNVDVAVRLRNASTVDITGEQIEAQ